MFLTYTSLVIAEVTHKKCKEPKKERKKESIFHHKNIRVNNTTANLYRGLAGVSAVAEAQRLVVSFVGESIYQHKEAYHYVVL